MAVGVRRISYVVEAIDNDESDDDAVAERINDVIINGPLGVAHQPTSTSNMQSNLFRLNTQVIQNTPRKNQDAMTQCLTDLMNYCRSDQVVQYTALNIILSRVRDERLELVQTVVNLGQYMPTAADVPKLLEKVVGLRSTALFLLSQLHVCCASVSEFKELITNLNGQSKAALVRFKDTFGLEKLKEASWYELECLLKFSELDTDSECLGQFCFFLNLPLENCRQVAVQHFADDTVKIFSQCHTTMQCMVTAKAVEHVLSRYNSLALDKINVFIDAYEADKMGLPLLFNLLEQARNSTKEELCGLAKSLSRLMRALPHPSIHSEGRCFLLLAYCVPEQRDYVLNTILQDEWLLEEMSLLLLYEIAITIPLNQVLSRLDVLLAECQTSSHVHSLLQLYTGGEVLSKSKWLNRLEQIFPILVEKNIVEKVTNLLVNEQAEIRFNIINSLIFIIDSGFCDIKKLPYLAPTFSCCLWIVCELAKELTATDQIVWLDMFDMLVPLPQSVLNMYVKGSHSLNIRFFYQPWLDYFNACTDQEEKKKMAHTLLKHVEVFQLKQTDLLYQKVCGIVNDRS